MDLRSSWYGTEKCVLVLVKKKSRDCKQEVILSEVKDARMVHEQMCKPNN